MVHDNDTLEARNVAVLQAWTQEVFNQHRLDRVEHLKVPDYVDWNPYPGQNIALSGFKAVLERWLEAFPDFRYDPHEELGDGDTVICLGAWYGTQTGPFMGRPPTGREMSARRVDIVRLSGPMMVERWGTGTELQMLEYLDVLHSTGNNPPATEAEAVTRLVNETLADRNLASVDELVGRDALCNIRELTELLLLAASLENVSWTVNETDGDDGVNVTLTGTRQKAVWGSPADGSDLTLTARFAVDVNAGVINHLTVRFDRQALAERLGVDPGVLVASGIQPTHTAGDARFVMRAVVQDLFNNRDFDVTARTYSENATGYIQEALTWYAFLTGFPDYQFNIERVLIDGERVIVLTTFAGTHTGRFADVEPTGRGVVTRSISVFAVRDGVAYDAWYTFDIHTLLTQLDAFPLSGSAEAV